MPSIRPLFHLRTLPGAALAVAACASGSAAFAQAGDPAAGAALYVQRVNTTLFGPANCEDCHSAAATFRGSFVDRGIDEAGVLTRLNGAIGSNQGGMGAYGSWSASQRADVVAYVMGGSGAPPPPPVAAPPTPVASPNPVMFGSTAAGSSSATAGVLFTNASTTTVFFANPAVTAAGAQAGDFTLVPPPAGTAACPATGGALGPGMSCSFGARFSPQGAGSRSATWNINFTSGVATRQVTLQGTATGTPAPAPSPAPTPSPAPSPAPTPAPGPAPAAASEGGGAFADGWTALAGMLALLAAAGRRRRGTPRPR